MRYTIYNTFHDTETTTKYSAEQREGIDARIYQRTATNAEKQARRRAWNKLCGISGCTCCNSWGERNI